MSRHTNGNIGKNVQICKKNVWCMLLYKSKKIEIVFEILFS